MNTHNPLLARLRYHVTGAIERGEGKAIVEIPANPRPRKPYGIRDVRIYDNGGKTCDRYTVAFPWDRDTRPGRTKLVAMVGMNERPFHPQGFCQHSEGVMGRHLGKRISYTDLNDDCAAVVRRELAGYNDNEG